MTSKVFDDKKEEIWKNEVVMKDFASLRSKTEFYGNVEVTTSETLTPYDIYAMYVIGIGKLFE